MTTAFQVTESCAHHGEGPFWDERIGQLRFVDMLAGDVLTLDPSGRVARSHVSDVTAVIRDRVDGGYIVATERGFALTNDDLTMTRSLPVFDNTSIRMNEGGCDPQGRFYCGSMAYDYSPGAGTLYRLDPNLTVHRVLESVTISNGIQWSSDKFTVYYSDTATGHVDAFDFDAEAGRFENRRPFIVVDDDQGAPDGVAIDQEGGLWVALWGGGAVHRYAPDGKLTDVVPLPVTNVTSCTFGGPARSLLYITTSRQGVDMEAEPAAGALFSADVGVTGARQYSFSG